MDEIATSRFASCVMRRESKTKKERRKGKMRVIEYEIATSLKRYNV